MIITPRTDWTRRRLLKVGAMVGAGLAIPNRYGWGQATLAHRYEVSLHQYSLKSLFDSGQLTLPQYAAFVKDRFGINNLEFAVEYCQHLLGNPREALALRKISEDQGVRNRVFLGGEQPLLDSPQADQRRAAVEEHVRWTEVADGLGCQYLRIRASGSEGTAEDQMRYASDGISALCEAIRDSSVSLLIENIMGFSRQPPWLIDLVADVGRHRVGVLADFGNFDGDVYDGMQQLLPYTESICTKSWEFDAQGHETTIDFEKMMTHINRSKFHGCIAIEYLGEKPLVGIPQTVALIRKFAQ